MIHNAEKLVNFLCEHGITFNQFMLPYLLHIDKRDNRGPKDSQKTSLTVKVGYYLRDEVGLDLWFNSDIELLVKKGFIVNKNINNELFISRLEVTNEFIKALFVTEDMFMEFWNAYPAQVPKGDGTFLTLRAVVPDELRKLYESKVDPSIHQTLVAAIRWATAKNMINVRIDNFIVSEMYITVIEAMKKALGGLDNSLIESLYSNNDGDDAPSEQFSI